MWPLFESYNLFYERAHATYGDYLVAFPIASLIATFCFGLFKLDKDGIRLVFLSVAGFIIHSSLFYPHWYAWTELNLVRAVGAILLASYPLVFSMYGRRPNISRIPLSMSITVGVVILLSLIIKCTYLETWPQVLTDYGARTGAQALELWNTPSLEKVLSRKTSWMSGGGTSIIHAPLLLLNFKLFGYTTFAVRFTEVIFSTATLGFLWLFLRKIMHPLVALGGVALFGLSAEHLSFSRMGTYYSASQALAILIILLWTHLFHQGNSRKLSLCVVTLCTLLVPFAYAAVKPLLVFSAVAGMVRYNCLRAIYKPSLFTRKQWSLYLLFLLCAAGLLYQYVFTQPPFFSLGSSPQRLATDSAVWFKTDFQHSSRVLQGPVTIAKNIFDNIILLATRSITEEHSFGFHKLHLIFTLVLLGISFTSLFTTRNRTLGLFLILAFTPQLLVMPLFQRGILMRPFIGVTIALFIFEYLRVSRAVVRHRSIQSLITASLLTAVCTVPITDIYRFTKSNGPAGVGPSFGPEYVQDLLIHLKKLDPKTPLVILNTRWSSPKYQMALATRIYDKHERNAPVLFRTLGPTSPAHAIPYREGPLYLAILNEQHRLHLLPWINKHIPNARIEAHGKDDKIYYWIIKINAP